MLVGGFRHKSGESKWEFCEWRFLPLGVDWGASAIDPRSLPKAINASWEPFGATAVPNLVAIWCSGGGSDQVDVGYHNGNKLGKDEGERAISECNCFGGLRE